MQVSGYNEIKKIYGPYDHSDGNGRKNVILYFVDGTKATVSNARWIMEQHLGRRLETNEHVDHINRDCTDDRIDNLQVVDSEKHKILDAGRNCDVYSECVWCGESFTIVGSKINNRRRGKAGPFCSPNCSGKYGASIQRGKVDKLDPQNHIVEKYYLDK